MPASPSSLTPRHVYCSIATTSSEPVKLVVAHLETPPGKKRTSNVENAGLKGICWTGSQTADGLNEPSSISSSPRGVECHSTNGNVVVGRVGHCFRSDSAPSYPALACNNPRLPRLSNILPRQCFYMVPVYCWHTVLYLAATFYNLILVWSTHSLDTFSSISHALVSSGVAKCWRCFML